MFGHPGTGYVILPRDKFRIGRVKALERRPLARRNSLTQFPGSMLFMWCNVIARLLQQQATAWMVYDKRQFAFACSLSLQCRQIDSGSVLIYFYRDVIMHKLQVTSVCCRR